MRRGHSQVEAARRIGVSRYTISRWERGEGSVSLSRVRDVQEYLDLTPEEWGELEGAP
jgi:transcriptional regulator with XRE-family HTH domain